MLLSSFFISFAGWRDAGRGSSLVTRSYGSAFGVIVMPDIAWNPAARIATRAETRLMRGQQQTKPELQCRWRWRVGDVAIWDNRATHHHALADDGKQPRKLHRVTLAGEAPR